MPALNDLTSNPWVIAEQGVVTTKNCRVAEIQYHEPELAGDECILENKDGHLLARFTEDQNSVDHAGWFNGITVKKLDSGYLLMYFQN